MPERRTASGYHAELVTGWSAHRFSRASRSETREYEIDIYVMRANGTHLRQVTAPGALWEDYGPQWSPNGNRLAFFRVNPDRDAFADSALFTVHLDGTHLRRLTSWHLNADQGQDWSPKWTVDRLQRMARGPDLQPPVDPPEWDRPPQDHPLE
jgi:Tol biopolymer transport system component